MAVPFGYKIRWLAVPTQEFETIPGILGLKKTKLVGWIEGLETVYRSEAIFITPPIQEWTLVVGSVGEIIEPRTREMLMRLSQEFGSAYFFATHRIVELHSWAVAHDAQIVRQFCYIGESGKFTVNEGSRTAEEIELGLGSSEDLMDVPDEEDVLALAARWTVDPRTLDAIDGIPDEGILWRKGWFG